MFYCIALLLCYNVLIVKETNMSKIKPSLKNQRGFALLHILPAFVLVAGIAFVGGSVYQAQVKKQEAARIAAEDAERKKQAELSIKDQAGTEEKEIEVPAPAEEQKPVDKPATQPESKPEPTPPETKPKPSYTYVGISSVSHNVSGDSVTLTATLPSTYSGTCSAKVKLKSDYSKYQYATATFNGNTCNVTISKSSLTGLGAGGFIAFMSWHNNEYTVKGDHGGYEFNL
jgi:cytoskeletal protein RodZ